ncbi:MAG TPA: DNA polymerase subunit beta [Archaeoglobus veneficus]|nr:DNA polymerase subunit beta [Archaeoglobus veneficus]
MVEKEIIEKDFEFLRDKVLAVLIFGSSVGGEGRDVDICIVAPEGFDVREVFRNIDIVGKGYDVWVFEELPLYMKMEVIDNHEIVFAKDELELYEYFYYFRKLWKDQEKRSRLSKDELKRILSANPN